MHDIRNKTKSSGHDTPRRGFPLKTIFFVLGFFAVLGAGLSVPRFFSLSYDRTGEVLDDVAEAVTKPAQKKSVPHLATPEPLKAIYMSQCVVGTPGFRSELVELIDDTELNAVVIDVKDYTGKLGFSTDNAVLADSVSDACGARDMRDFLKLLRDKNIYTIARVTVFQDPYYTSVHPELAVKKESDGSVWKDHKGLSFIDVGAEDFWEYIVVISREAYDIGFDEINFDYVRYPSDGNMKDIAFTLSGGRPKEEVLEDFFSYLFTHLSEPWEDNDGVPKLSVDLFGYTTTNTDDLGIGQLLERALPYFDYVMPMVYPSHYNQGFIGIAKPATAPYEVVKYSMDASVRRVRALMDAPQSTATTTEATFLREQAKKGHKRFSILQMRPWLQDFDLGATYTPDMVRAQMKAAYDAGLTSWALWDAGNTYTRGALLIEEQSTLTEEE